MRARLDLRPPLADLLAEDEGAFETLWDIGDKVIRDHGERRTARFERGGKAFFIKRYGAPARSLVRRRDDETATAELRALERAAAAGLAVPAIAGYGTAEDGRTLIVLAALPDTISLETLVARWREAPPPAAERRALIRTVAEMVRKLHAAGINHRDLYLPHFHVPQADPTGGAMYLIDLQRAQLRDRVPRRWQVKDLGGLWFSAMDAGLSRTDQFRFVAAYTGASPAQTLREDRALWRAVERRARRTYARHGGVPVPPHLRSAS